MRRMASLVALAACTLCACGGTPASSPSPTTTGTTPTTPTTDPSSAPPARPCPEGGTKVVDPVGDVRDASSGKPVSGHGSTVADVRSVRLVVDADELCVEVGMREDVGAVAVRLDLVGDGGGRRVITLDHTDTEDAEGIVHVQVGDDEAAETIAASGSTIVGRSFTVRLPLTTVADGRGVAEPIRWTADVLAPARASAGGADVWLDSLPGSGHVPLRPEPPA